MEEKRWYTVTMFGNVETIIKDIGMWKEMGYVKLKETEDEVILVKKNKEQ